MAPSCSLHPKYWRARPPHRKKRITSFPSPAGMPLTKLPPGQELFSYDVIIPAQGEFGSDIPAGDGKLANLFLRCCCFSPTKCWRARPPAVPHLPNVEERCPHTVRKKNLILRSIERRPQMQFSMVRKFPLWRLRRYSVKYSKVRNFTFNAPCQRKLNNTSWERTNILWIFSPPLYHCATFSWEIEDFFQVLCFFFAKFKRFSNIPLQWIQNGRYCVKSYAA